jgi:DNA-binding XRE family transcriptional regulator
VLTVSKARPGCKTKCAVKLTFYKGSPATFVFIKNVSQLNVIGPQVRKLREQKGWTQGEFAAKLQLEGWDTSRESVTRLETQDRRVPDLELFILAKVLGVGTDDLFPRNLRGKIKALWPHYRVKLSRGQVPPTP